MRRQRIGRVHQDIGLAGYHVDAAMHFLRERFRQEVAAHIRDGRAKEPLLVSLHKALDIHLSIITAAFQRRRTQPGLPLPQPGNPADPRRRAPAARPQSAPGGGVIRHGRQRRRPLGQ